MDLIKAREDYEKGKITFDELHNVFFKLAPSTEIDRFWGAPVYDRPGVVLGRTPQQLDKEWEDLIGNNLKK